jgi:hypothetical protein
MKFSLLTVAYARLFSEDKALTVEQKDPARIIL